MSEKIILEMTREQAQAVMNATELLARLHIGQFEEIAYEFGDRFVGDDGKFDSERRDIARAYLAQACMAIFGADKYGFPDIGERTITHERCWAVYTTIRYALAWHDNPVGNPWSVAFDKPMGYGEKMPTAEVRDE